MNELKDPSVEAAREPFLALVRELVKTYQAYCTCSGRHVRALGLTVPQFDVLATLGNTEGMTLGLIAERTLITKSSLTGIIDRLEAKGLVQRITHAKDRRRIHAVLTPEGNTLFQEVFPEHVTHMKQFFDALSESERDQAVALLGRLRLLFEKSDETS